MKLFSCIVVLHNSTNLLRCLKVNVSQVSHLTPNIALRVEHIHRVRFSKEAADAQFEERVFC